MAAEVEARPTSASIRRTFTLRNSAARQVAVNFMPSRQHPYNAAHHRRNNSEHNALLEEVIESMDTPDAADIIVREMEQQQRLMEDSPVAEELRREVLRELPQGLTMKRNVRAKLSASVSLRSKRRPISLMKRLRYRISFAWKRFQDRLRNVIFSIELWYEAIRSIEGHFGSAVGSYFYLVRWLFAMDLMLAALVVAFLVLPQTLHDETRNRTSETSALDIITGKGRLEDSLLFYGHYHNGVLNTAGPLSYYMPFAYFFTMVCLYLMFFAILCYRTAYSYRRNFIDTAGGLSHVFASKVFCGWDFGIVSTQAAALNANSIYNEFKELLSEMNKKQLNLSFWVKFGQLTCNLLITLVVLSMIVCVEFGLWHLLSVDPYTSYWEIVISAIVTLIVTIFPLLFHAVVKLEYYRPRTAFYVTLARTWLLDIGTLMLIFVYWVRSGVECWETRFGQEAYRLVLLDAFISLFLLPLVEFLRALVYKLNPDTPAPEFNIAFNSLTLIYNQAVLWFGMLFSPLLVVCVTIKFLVLFYVKKECAMRACRPARKVWRAAQTQTVLYMLVTLSLFATLFGIGSLFFNTSSHSCGPFRTYEYVYTVLSEGVLRLSVHHSARAVIIFLTRPGFIAFLLLFLCVSVYYMRAKALAQHSMVQILRHMLILQAKDKDFLLTAIAKVSNGEWHYNPKSSEEEEGPDSHTWKYLREVRKPSNSGFNFDGSRLSHCFVEGGPRALSGEGPGARAPGANDGDTDSSFSWQGSQNDLHGDGTRDKKWL